MLVRETAFRHDCIESHVVRFRCDVFDVLQLIRNADESGRTPRRSEIEEREGAIVVPASHAETQTVCIEAHERKEHEVEPSCTDGSPARRLIDAEMIGTHRAIARREVDAPRVPIDARQVDLATARECELDQRRSIELFGHRRIERDALTGLEMKNVIYVRRNATRSEQTLAGAERAPPGAQLGSKEFTVGFVVGHARRALRPE